MQVNLYDHHRSEAEKTYENYHPNEEKEPEAVFGDSKQDVADYTKGYNEAYILFQENKELTTSLNRSFEDKEIPRAEGFQKCSQEMTQKEVKAELDNLENRSPGMNMDKSRDRGLSSYDTPDKDSHSVPDKDEG